MWQFEFFFVTNFTINIWCSFFVCSRFECFFFACKMCQKQLDFFSEIFSNFEEFIGESSSSDFILNNCSVHVVACENFTIGHCILLIGTWVLSCLLEFEMTHTKGLMTFEHRTANSEHWKNKTALRRRPAVFQQMLLVNSFFFLFWGALTITQRLRFIYSFNQAEHF